ncbi:MAG: hypothetical protein IKP26_02940 [Clostridia bacterium]|nr:hypothetical protein [Clostridia bacterium]
MEDIVLIVSMAALFAFGLIPVVKLDRFIRGRRIVSADPARRSRRERRSAEDDQLDEFESSGILYFDLPCDPGQIDSRDIERME